MVVVVRAAACSPAVRNDVECEVEWSAMVVVDGDDDDGQSRSLAMADAAMVAPLSAAVRIC